MYTSYNQAMVFSVSHSRVKNIPFCRCNSRLSRHRILKTYSLNLYRPKTCVGENANEAVFFTNAAAAFLRRLIRGNKQGPVVQSIVSLTSSLRGQLFKCFTTL